MIIRTLNISEVTGILLEDEYAKWTYEAAKTLAEYYDDLSDDIGEPFELDIVAIRCEWSEYTAKDLFHAFYNMIDMTGDDDENLGNLVEEIGQNTTIIELESSFLVMDF